MNINDAPVTDNIDTKETIEVSKNEFSNDVLPEVQWGDEFFDLEEIELPRGDDFHDTDSGEVPAPKITGHQSLFNDYHLFKYKGPHANAYPRTDDEYRIREGNKLYADIKLTDLIKNPLGHRIYKAADFLYLEDIGSPINRMITLRRFPFPILDDITDTSTIKDHDIGRLVTFMTEDVNKLSDFMTFDYGMNWRPLEASTERADMQGDQNGVNGYMKDILRFVDPKFGREAMMGENRLDYNPIHDNNRVYGPVDSIHTTHIRDIGLRFEFETTLTFRYKLDSINGINGKAAFIDLISNILAVTMNNGKFWGGARFWTGPRPTRYLKDLQFLSATSFDDFLTKGFDQMKVVLNKFTGPNAKTNVVNLLKTIAFNALNLGFGQLLDKVGRPSIPMITSLLTNAPIGNWHLTVGNPMNPIITIGNLILTNSKLGFGDTLGYDDFPDEIVLEVTLKPAMPKDKAGIESMFNLGKGRTYWKPTDEALKKRRSGGKRRNPDHGLVYNELISRPIDALATGRYDAAEARDVLKDVIYDFRQLKK
ncbi:gp269 [Sphingomonas phage PAU]|uniref:gp269 n=1 Tax=Sphingomonas phage PAU TaxID=1150991 RepID=UPI0002573413|nr:gp269 [Sphingomonas phage PAU]AFF28267.1 gp269 [Sphingomonas phage PAU]